MPFQERLHAGCPHHLHQRGPVAKKYVVSNMVASLSLDGQMSYALNSLDF